MQDKSGEEQNPVEVVWHDLRTIVLPQLVCSELRLDESEKRIIADVSFKPPQTAEGLAFVLDVMVWAVGRIYDAIGADDGSAA